MNDNKIDQLQKRNFFSKEDNFIKNFHIKSKLIYGTIKERIPFITIIMPTYKRSNLIKDAIKSVLNQKDFDDYELLIVDNEDLFDVETETERVVKAFNSEKILYYRNEKNISAYGNWNRCVELARSNWICMLHDDDVLVENHLISMTNVIKSNIGIDFLSCNHIYIDERNNVKVDVNEYIKSADVLTGDITFLNYKDYNFEFRALFLGAIFNRNKAIEIGGFSVGESLIEDYVFVAKYAYYYRLYQYAVELYGYRWGNNESLNCSIWQEQLVYEYYLYRFISKKRFILIRPMFLLYSKYCIINLTRSHINGTSFLKTKCSIDESKIYKDCGFKDEGISKIALLISKVFIRIANYINRCKYLK